MDFADLIRQRYSCRNYQPKPVPESLLKTILSQAALAPSAVNFQPWEVIVVNKPEKLEIIHKAYPREWIKTAPMVLIICTDHGKSWKRSDNKDFADVDGAIFTDHLTLAATYNNLATCWVCNFNREIVSAEFSLPDNIEPLVILPLGYPAKDEIPEKKRKEISSFIRMNNY